jgi:hypothetical protein
MFTTCQNLNTHSSPMQAGCKRWNKPFLPSTYRPRPLRRSFTTPPVAAVAVGAGTNPSPFPAAGPPPPGYTRRSLYSCIGKVKRGISTKPLLHRDFWVVRQTSGQNQMNSNFDIQWAHTPQRCPKVEETESKTLWTCSRVHMLTFLGFWNCTILCFRLLRGPSTSTSCSCSP